MFLLSAFDDPVRFFSIVLIVIFSICVHEFCHALAALWQGDDTAAQRGYLSLNPMVHMGATSIVMLVLIGIAWGQTPVNRARLRNPYSDALVSFAGPLANLALMTLAVVLAVQFAANATVSNILALAAWMNAYLFLFNMLPVPPLDGFGVLETFVPAFRRQASGLSRYGFLIVMLLFLFFGLGSVLGNCAHRMVAEVAQVVARR